MTRPKPKKPRPIKLGHGGAIARSNDNEKWVRVEALWMNNPRDVERLIKFLDKAVLWLKDV